MSIVSEFKDFAVKGNVVDMAVGVIIGGAFGKIVSSVVADIIMPPVGKALGGVNFADLFLSLDPEKTKGITSLVKAKETGAAIIAYGQFINTCIDFAILAFCVFLMVKAINSIRKQLEKPVVAAPAAPAEPPAQEKLLAEIRDLLKQQAAR